MSLSIRQCKTPADYRRFVGLPFRLYRGEKNWVPPLKQVEIKALSPKSNPAFAFCNTAWWIAERDGEVVGRIGIIIHHLHNEKMGEKMARITRPEFIDDEEVSGLLFQTAESFARENGMNGIQGPLGFSNLDHQGLLVEGFDELPSVVSEYHHPWYQAHFERAGYQKEMDWVEFRLTIKAIPEKAIRLGDMIRQRYGLTVHRFTRREELRAYANKLFDLLNTSFSGLFSVTALNDAMKAYYTDRYLALLNPRFVVMITDGSNELVGFIVGMPSLSTAMQRAKGRLLPFGWWHLRQAMKNPEVVDLVLTAVHPRLQAQGVPAILITELQQVLLDHGVKFVETTGMLETNEKAIQVWKNYEHVQHKRKRCYRKQL